MGYHLRVKVCGVTTLEDAERAVGLGADALGLNFHPGSRRFITPALAAQIVRALPPYIEAVGVFVDVPQRQAMALLEPLGRVRTIQMHGENGELPSCFPYQFIPAFQVRTVADLERITRYLQQGQGRLAGVLVDGHAPGLHGGTGQVAPWDLLATFQPEVPLILAGGLTADNVAEAVRQVRPYAVDVASGVESAPGRKDAEKIRRFIVAAREAASKL